VVKGLRIKKRQKNKDLLSKGVFVSGYPVDKALILAKPPVEMMKLSVVRALCRDSGYPAVWLSKTK